MTGAWHGGKGAGRRREDRAKVEANWPTDWNARERGPVLQELSGMAASLEARGVPGPYRVELGEEVCRALVDEGSVPAGWAGQRLVLGRGHG